MPSEVNRCAPVLRLPSARRSEGSLDVQLILWSETPTVYLVA